MKINFSNNMFFEYSVNRVMHPTQEIFRFYEADRSNRLGTLICHKSELPIRPNSDKSVLAIDFLEVFQKDKGTGTKIIKFAQEHSINIGCNGYITLKADSTFTPQRIPHIFYRKLGFSTFDENLDKKMDKYISKNKNATSKDFPCLLMHYPPKSNKPLTFAQKFILLFKRFFN